MFKTGFVGMRQDPFFHPDVALWTMGPLPCSLQKGGKGGGGSHNTEIQYRDIFIYKILSHCLKSDYFPSYPLFGGMVAVRK